MGRVIPASEVLSNRVKNRFWSPSARAPNLKRPSKGDKVIFYITEAIEKSSRESEEDYNEIIRAYEEERRTQSMRMCKTL